MRPALKWWFLIALAFVLFLYATVTAHCQVFPPAIFSTPFTAITAPTTSNPVTNIGQIQHVIKIEFPTAKGTVTPIQVRLEASYTNTAGTYFPITSDVTTVTTLLGTPTFYAFAVAYGAFPYVRVRSLVSTPSSLPMTVRYFGHAIPIVPFATLLSDRYVF